MGYPTEQRFKILQQQYQDAQQISVPAPMMKPQMMPGVIIDYIARTDSGFALKVIPFVPTVTSAGELTFSNGGSNVPSDANQRFYVMVFPADTAPTAVESTYSIGEVITYFPYWGTGGNHKIRGTYICIGTSPTLPQGEIQFQSYQMGSNNQTVWDFQRAHSMLT